MMNISQAARQSGLSPKAIRYYEAIGLVAPASRGGNGYRRYDSTALDELRFLSRARQVGFDLDECRQLLDLLRDPQRQSVHARDLVLDKRQQVEARISALKSMARQLDDMAQRCNGNEGPDCAILDDLAQGGGHDE